MKKHKIVTQISGTLLFLSLALSPAPCLAEDLQEPNAQQGAEASGPAFKQLRYEALSYLNGDGVEQDYEKAAELFTQAANAGDISSAYYLGQMYEEGTGVAQSLESALLWYEKAVEQLDSYLNNPDNSGPDELKLALCALAENALSNGDEEGAVSYYESAAALGWEEASLKLSELLGEEGAETDASPDSLEGGEAAAKAGAVSNTLAEDTDALIEECVGKFALYTYEDAESGLSIDYNLFLPEGCTEETPCPMVVFIADSSCVGSTESSLTQGRGALVWASDEWQSRYPTIVAVPTYPEVILDDHGSYTVTDYVALTGRFINWMKENYPVERVFGTGQSMGCMTSLVLSSADPSLYTACMFVDGQWDTESLRGLSEETFVYFAAEDDTNAWNGAQELMALFDTEGVSYAYAQWDGSFSADERSAAASELFNGEESRYFISWKSGTIEPKTGSMGASSGEGFSGRPFGEGFSGPQEGEGFTPPEGGDFSPSEESEGGGAGMNSSAYHMASFDYAYNCTAVMEWLITRE